MIADVCDDRVATTIGRVSLVAKYRESVDVCVLSRLSSCPGFDQKLRSPDSGPAGWQTAVVAAVAVVVVAAAARCCCCSPPSA